MNFGCAKKTSLVELAGFAENSDVKQALSELVPIDPEIEGVIHSPIGARAVAFGVNPNVNHTQGKRDNPPVKISPGQRSLLQAASAGAIGWVYLGRGRVHDQRRSITDLNVYRVIKADRVPSKGDSVIFTGSVNVRTEKPTIDLHLAPIEAFTKFGQSASILDEPAQLQYGLGEKVVWAKVQFE
jgi:hypothetical protein